MTATPIRPVSQIRTAERGSVVPMSEDQAARLIEGQGRIEGKLDGISLTQGKHDERLTAHDVRLRLLEQRPVPPSLSRIVATTSSAVALVATAVVLLDRFMT